MPDQAKEHSFESAIERLRTLVQEMESDRLPLEGLLKAYEEGIGLVKVCQDRLGQARQKLELLEKKSTGELTTRPFDPASTAAPEPALKKPSRDIALF